MLPRPRNLPRVRPALLPMKAPKLPSGALWLHEINHDGSHGSSPAGRETQNRKRFQALCLRLGANVGRERWQLSKRITRPRYRASKSHRKPIWGKRRLARRSRSDPRYRAWEKHPAHQVRIQLRNGWTRVFDLEAPVFRRCNCPQQRQITEALAPFWLVRLLSDVDAVLREPLEHARDVFVHIPVLCSTRPSDGPMTPYFTEQHSAFVVLVQLS
jgi:hypothetical protein